MDFRYGESCVSSPVSRERDQLIVTGAILDGEKAGLAYTYIGCHYRRIFRHRIEACYIFRARMRRSRFFRMFVGRLRTLLLLVSGGSGWFARQGRTGIRVIR